MGTLINVRSFLFSQLICSGIVILFSCTAHSYGSPEFLPNGPHPRIWLTASVISEIKAKRVANTIDWQNLIARSEVFSSYIDSEPYRLDWPGGAGYAGSGYQDALMTWGLLYYGYKTSAYGTASETSDDVTARGYATKAINMLISMVTYYSSGEELDGIDLIRMNDRLYMFNSAESAINSALTGTAALSYRAGQTRLITYKNGYAARTTATVLPIVYDWFCNDPLFTNQLKTILYKIMFRHIDWFRGVRSTYNNGILINGVRYHEDNIGDCTGINNCTINDTNDHEPRRQKGYSFGKIGANFYEGFVGMAMLVPLAVYGDAPQIDSDNYLTYSKQLWADHQSTLNSTTGFKGGDSPEGLYYNSSWDSFLNGLLGLKTSTGIDVFTGLDFPKDVARNFIHNSNSALNKMVHRGAWSSSQPNQWMVPLAQPINSTSHILRNYYNEPEEVKLLQQYLNTATIANQGLAWERFLWRNDANASTKALTTEPLYYRSIGTGTVTLRSSWDKSATDTVLTQISLKGSQRTDHEQYGDGYFLLSRGPDRLISRLKYTNFADDESAPGQNTVVFNDTSNLPSNISDPDYIAPLNVPAIDREEHGSTYDYLSADLSNSWKYNSSTFPGAQDKARYFRRSLVYLRPSIVILHDTTRSNSIVGNLKSWNIHFEAAPIIDIPNRLITATVGNSKVFVKGLNPLSGTYIDTDLSSSSHASVATVFHRVKFTPTVSQEYDQFLHVIEATGSTAIQTPVEKVQSVEGKMIGAYIKDATNPSVVMFSTDKDGLDATGNVTYILRAIAGKSPWHTIVNLPKDTNYNVVRQKDTPTPGAETYQLIPTPGAVHKTSSQGVLRIPPNISIQTPAEGATIAGKKKVSVLIPDTFTVTALELMVDGVSTASTFTSPNMVQPDSLLPGGSHQLSVLATDADGNKSLSAPIAVTVVTDSTAPTVTISSPVEGQVVSGSVTVAISASDDFDVVNVRFYVDGNLDGFIGSTPYSISWNTLLNGNGSHVLTADASDSSGNTGASPVVTVTVDNAPPTINFNPVTSPTKLTTQTIGGTVGDNVAVASVTVKVGSGSTVAATVVGGSWSYNLNGLSIGPNSITVTATDTAGNSSIASTSIVVDQTAPTVAISPVTSPTKLSGQSIGGTVSDNIAVASVTVQIGSGATNPASINGGTWSYTLSGLAVGSNSITVTAQDTAGNSSIASTSIVVDQTVPAVAINPVTSPTKLTTQALSGTVSDNVAVASVTVQIGSGSAAAAAVIGGTWSYNLTGLTAGSNSIFVTAQDAAGNSTTVQTTIVVDQTLPVVGSFSIPATSTSLTVSSIVFSASDNIGVTGYLITESSTAPAAAAINLPQPPTSYVFSSSGNKTLYAWARDAAGNVSLSSSAVVTINPVIGSYPSLQNAYSSVPNGGLLFIGEGTLMETFTANRNVTVTIEGGYDAAFTDNPGFTVINGKVSIQSGKVVFEKIKVR